MALTEDMQFKARVLAQEQLTLFLIKAINQLVPNAGLVPALSRTLKASVPSIGIDGIDTATSDEFRAEVLRIGQQFIDAVSDEKPAN